MFVCPDKKSFAHKAFCVQIYFNLFFASSELDFRPAQSQFPDMSANQFTRPPWTQEEARAYAIKGNIRKKELAREREAATTRRIAELEEQLADALARIPISDDTRRSKTLDQIDKTDKMINDALDEGDREAFVELTDVKQKLWKLALAVPGQARGRRSAAMLPPSAVPLGLSTTQEPQPSGDVPPT